MLVSHIKRFIYTKTIKTAGTSIEAYFEPYCVPKDGWAFSPDCDEYIGETGIVGCRGRNRQSRTWYNHMSAKAIKKQLGSKLWKEYFKFCVVRNPFDQLVSAFHYREWVYTQGQRQGNGQFPRSRTLKGSSEEFLATIQHQSSIERFRTWIAWGGAIGDRNKYLINGKFCLDYFIRFEQLQADVQHVCTVLDIPFQPDNIMRLKSGTRPKEFSLRDYYDTKTIDLVTQAYALELDRFGYEPPS